MTSLCIHTVTSYIVEDRIEKNKVYYYGKSKEPLWCIIATNGNDGQSTFMTNKGSRRMHYNHDMHIAPYCKK